MYRSSIAEQEFISNLSEKIEANLNNEQFGVSELANEVGMSRSNLHRKVKSIENLSVSQFIRKIRLRKALELLKQTGLTVSEVTWQVGFGSTSYFIKCFHEHYGFPPGEVGRKNNANEELIDKKAAKPFVKIRLKFLWITLLLLIFLILFFFNKENVLSTFSEGSSEVIKDATFSIEVDNQTKDYLKIIDADCFEILLQDAVLRKGGGLLLSQKEFDFMYPETKNSIKIPQKEIEISLINRDINYELIAEIKDNTSGRILEINHTINEATDLLTSDILVLADSIVVSAPKIDPMTNNWDAFISYYEGVKSFNIFDVNKARLFLLKSINRAPDFDLPKLKLAELFHFLRNNQGAKSLVNEIQIDNSILNRVDSLRYRALENKLLGNYDAVIENYKALKSIMPANKEHYYELAEAYFGMREIDQAISNYNQALDIDKEYTLAMNHLAFCYSHIGEHKIALNWFRKYVQLDSSANAYDSYAQGFLSAGVYDSALFYSKEGLKIDPDLQYLNRKICFANLEKGKLKKAENAMDDYINSVNIPALKSWGLGSKAIIYYRNSDYEMVRDTCLKAKTMYDELSLLSRHHETHYLLARSFMMLGDFENADTEIREMEIIIDDYGINEFKYNEIFKLYKALKFIQYCKEQNMSKIQEIIDLFDGPISDKLKDWTSFFDLAYFNTMFGIELYGMNLYKQAEQRFEKALEYNPNYHLALFHLYLLNNKLGNNVNANLYRKQYLEILNDADADYLKKL